MSVLPEPPPSRQRTFGKGVAVGLLAAVLIAIVVFAAIVVLDDDGTRVAGPFPSPMPTPSSSSSPLPSPTASPSPKPVRQVEGDFHDQEWVKGDGLWLQAANFPLRDDDCTIHTFTSQGKTLGAYRSDCQSWENDGYDIILFYVALRNPTRRPLTFNVRNFVLTARDTRTFGSVNVGSKAEFPPNFLPENRKIPPRSNLVGYLTFDGRVRDLVPAQLNYVYRHQTLSVVFEGRHEVT